MMRMTNKLAKAVVPAPALTRVVGAVAVCQRGIVDVPRVRAERTAECDAGTQEPQHCRAQMLQTLDGVGSAELIP